MDLVHIVDHIGVKGRWFRIVSVYAKKTITKSHFFRRFGPFFVDSSQFLLVFNRNALLDRGRRASGRSSDCIRVDLIVEFGRPSKGRDVHVGL